MSWLDALPAVAVALALLLLPGLPVAWALGARGITFLALSVAGSVSAVGISAVAAPFAGLSWAPYVPFLLSVPVALVAVLLRLLWRRRFAAQSEPGAWGKPFLVAVGAVLLGGLLIGWSLVTGIPRPDLPSQSYDAIFHLNAVRQVLDTGNGSTLNLNLSSPGSATVFYPAAWHDFASLVVQLTGVSIPVAANALTLAITCFAWPVAAVFLVRQIFGNRRLTLLLAGVLSAAFAAFPLLMAQFGVLYPNLLAFSVLPVALGLLVAAVGKGADAGLEPPGRWLALFWVLGGIGIAHPNAIFGFMVLSLPLVAQGVIEYSRRGWATPAGRRRAIGAIVVATAAVLASAAVWTRVGTSDNAWIPDQTLAQAAGEALLNATVHRPPAIIATALVFLGVIWAIRGRRGLWLAVSYLFAIGLYVVAAGMWVGQFRTAVTGLWYNDSYRLAAMIPVVAVPLAVAGALQVVERVERWLKQRAEHRDSEPATRRRVPAIAAASVLLLLVPLTHDWSINAAQEALASTYRLEENAPVLSPDELEIFRIVEEETPEDAVIAGNPWNGSALVYAYTGRRTLFPHAGGAYPAARWEIAEELDSDPDATCAALRAEDTTYVLDFGGPLLFGTDPRAENFPGFDDLASSDAVTLVAEEGQARLYKITACGLN